VSEPLSTVSATPTSVGRLTGMTSKRGHRVFSTRRLSALHDPLLPFSPYAALLSVMLNSAPSLILHRRIIITLEVHMFIRSLCSQVCYPYSLHPFFWPHYSFFFFLINPVIRCFLYVGIPNAFPYLFMHCITSYPFILSLTTHGDSFSMLLLLNDRYART
jgi:hypothetical protein